MYVNVPGIIISKLVNNKLEYPSSTNVTYYSKFPTTIKLPDTAWVSPKKLQQLNKY